MKTTMRHRIARVLTLALVVCMLFALAVPASANGINEAVNDAKSAVVQIQLWYVDPEMADSVYLSFGTGFLINEDTVVTCQHVIEGFSDLWYAERALYTSEVLGRQRTAAEIRNNVQLRISVLRDVYVEATVVTSSAEMDYAVLKLKDKLYNRTTLPLRSSSDLKQTESIYALGFPGDLDDIVAQNYYDADDVTITSGNVNKIGSFSFNVNEGSPYINVECIESSARIVGGNSGGPLVDTNGAVVGINAVYSDDRNLSVASDQLIETLDALGISYVAASDVAQAEQPVETVPPATEAPAPVVTEAPATEAPATEAPVPAATEAPAPAQKEEGGSMMTILLIAGVAVVAVVVVVVVVMSKGKKQQAAPVGGSYAPPAPQRPAAPPANTGFTTAPVTPAGYTAPVAEAGETTVLSQDAGETTVLSHNVNGGTLIRKKNGESIKVNAESFVIGRERKTANYCISDNSSIGRAHAKLVVRNGATYLVDLKSTNGTFVNGVKAMPNQEIALKNGDKITLADEDLEFRI